MKNTELYRVMLKSALENSVEDSLPQYGPGGPTELRLPVAKGMGMLYGDKFSYGADLLNMSIAQGKNPMDIRLGEGVQRNAYYQQLVSAFGEQDARLAFDAAMQFSQSEGLNSLLPAERVDRFYNSSGQNEKLNALKSKIKNYTGTNSANSFVKSSPLVDLQDSMAKLSDGGPVNPLYLEAFNFLANQIATIKQDSDSKKYENYQAFDMQQPEPVSYNKAYRFGRFAAGGPLTDSMLGINAAAASYENIHKNIPIQSIDPAMARFTTALVTPDAPIVPPDVTEVMAEASSVPGFDFDQYTAQAQKYLDTLGTSKITGRQLAEAAAKSYAKYGRTVPPDLAVAQLKQEGYLAKGNSNKPQRTNNPFNVGNVDSGKVVKHSTVQSGIESYYNLMANSYLNSKSATDLLNKGFTNSAGNRYASDRNYEANLRRIIAKLNKK